MEGVSTINPLIPVNGINVQNANILPIPQDNIIKHAGGRPCEYCKNSDEIQYKTELYFKSCMGEIGGKVKIPYIEELALELDKDDDTIVEWAKKTNENGILEHAEFSATIKKLKTLQKLRLLQRTLGRYNPAGAIYQLKVNHGMIESERKIFSGDKNEKLQIEIVESTES